MTVETGGDESDRRTPGLLSASQPELRRAVCPVVGLGASAGGLEAFQNFLNEAPNDAGLAYVLVQHLDPNHESMLAELLGRRTSMPVRQVTDGMEIEPNHVYLIPPNASLVIEGARLRLSDFSEPRGFRRPIDVFFRSLAADQGANAACVVLSGTGADGSEGLRAVKEAGGLTVVQNPETAKYDGMPKSAVGTGLVDKVLDVREMPGAIREYFERGQSNVFNLPDVTEFLLRACEQLRQRIGHDFSQYKRSTMLRRVQRRMQVVGATNAGDYLSLLGGDNQECELLFRDLLINVTCFFRDAEAFDFIRREVIPQILQDKGAADAVRIWAPGCSSGEEAYSIAILMAEALTRLRSRPSVQIFATDIDEQMLNKARAASYPHSALKDIPIELFDRYFFAQEDDYVLSQTIRDMVRVSNHNLIKDPPFSRVDMLVCRNLLIYLNASLQQRLVPVFHYALRPQGWLFLGSAENIAARNDLFDTIEPSSRVYRRRGGHRQSVAMPLLAPAFAQRDRSRLQRANGASERTDLMHRRIMERYAPPHVVVNVDNNIVRSSNRTGKFLELAEGAPSVKVTDLAKRGLRSAVRAVLEGARANRKRSIRREVRMDSDDDAVSLVDVVADPLSDDEILLIFQEAAGARHEDLHDGETRLDGYSDEDRIKQLEEELDENRSKLRTTVEELETSNEELKSSNEEMMSMNEELQSANEELATVNEELKNKVDQLARTNSDLQNFIESTQIPTIFLDPKKRIRSFTPASRALFRVQEQDKGRSLADVVSKVEHERIASLTDHVLQTGEAEEQEVTVDEGKGHFVLRVLPYKDVHNAIDGCILVFTDVTKIREAQADLARNEGLAKQRSDEIETLYKTATVGMALVDRNQRLLKANQRFAALSGLDIDAHYGRALADILPHLADRMSAPIDEVFSHGAQVVNLEVAARGQDQDFQDFLIDFYPYEDSGRVEAVGIVLKDVTELRQLEKDLRRMMDELQHRVKNTLATVGSIVSQTVGARSDRRELVDTLKSRLGALAATHNLLSAENWRNASLRKILDAELSPFNHQERIAINGPLVRLPPKHALTLTLTIHELATNAAKYGALGAGGGSLRVDWKVTEDAIGRRLILEWVESGVQGISPGSAVESFGTRLIKNGVVHDLQGECEHVMRMDGVTCTLSIPF